MNRHRSIAADNSCGQMHWGEKNVGSALAGRALVTLAVLVWAASHVAAAAAQAPEGVGWQLSATTFPSSLVPAVNAVQEVTPLAEAPTFTLSFGGEQTSTLARTASAPAVQAALEALPAVGAGDVSVSQASVEAPYVVTFTGALGGTKVAEIEAEGASVAEKTEGAASGTIEVAVFNVGAAASAGAVTFTDRLPAGLHAKQAGELRRPDQESGSHFGVDPRIRNEQWSCSGNGPGPASGVAGATIVTCVDTNPIYGGGGIPIAVGGAPQPPVGISVESSGEASGLVNQASVAGGGALLAASTENAIEDGPRNAPSGLTSADVWFSNADGTIDHQAGSHPYAMTTVFNYATETPAGRTYPTEPGGELRNIEVQLPPGLVGQLQHMPQCTRTELQHTELGNCPESSTVGVLDALAALGGRSPHPLFNMVPPKGEAAEFGFKDLGVQTYLDFSVRTGGNYGISVHSSNIPQFAIIQVVAVIWGVPGDHSHDPWRDGQGCIESEARFCQVAANPELTPILTLPTQCGAPQPLTIRELGTWQNPDARSEVTVLPHGIGGGSEGIGGCDALSFEPATHIFPESSVADSQTGLTAEVQPPLGGLEDREGVGSSDIKDATVTLPPGFVVNPGQASGIQACSLAAAGLEALSNGEENDGPSACPPASQLGTVLIRSPLIEGAEEKQFEGGIYLLPSNPPEVKLLVAASADGVNVKLTGVAHLNETTGQVTTTFEGTPQVPASLFKLTFNGGAHAALDTPARCGDYGASSDLTPWSSPSLADFDESETVAVTEGAEGGACPGAQLPFAPTMTAGTVRDAAGGLTDFSMLLQRGDGSQRIEKLQFTAPKGLAGLISSVPLCAEAQASAGTCSQASQVGHAIVTAGPGANPLVIPQPGQPQAPIYLTGPYHGAPFGLSIVTPAVAGPFNLGTIVTRARIEINPVTAQITVTTDPLPQIIKGVPTDIRSVDAIVDRTGFMFNPTNCSETGFSGTATGIAAAGLSEAGSSAPLSSRFEVTGCRELAFAPHVAVSMAGHASKVNGQSLSVKISYPKGAIGSQAWFNGAKLQFPKQLPVRQSTLGQACLAATFETNRAACPVHSKIGTAVVHTQVLPVPLEGSVYFVSYGNAKFPSVVIPLSGDNVNVTLTGETLIKNGITSATFKGLPDVPFESFEVKLPSGKYSEFTGFVNAKQPYNFCGQKLKVPTALQAQNGREIHQQTPIAVQGCSTKLSLASHTLKGRNLTLSVYVPGAGKVKATGNGFSPVIKGATGQELVTLTVHVGRRGSFHDRVRLTYTPKKGKRQSTAVTLRL